MVGYWSCENTLAQKQVDLAHRLDRDTSGLLLLTKDKATNQRLKKAFRDGAIKKTYLGICRGEVPWNEKEILQRIGASQGPLRVKQAARPDGLLAQTLVRVLERKHGLSLVECTIKTGRNHQIRVHLESEGHALIGDRVYGVPPEVFLHSLNHGIDAFVRAATGAPRHALHCVEMIVPDPAGLPLTLKAPLFPDISSWWANPSQLPHGKSGEDT